MKDEREWPIDKRIPVTRLMELLAGLPPECQVMPNAVRNLTVFDSAGEPIGMIDFLTNGTFESWTQEAP